MYLPDIPLNSGQKLPKMGSKQQMATHMRMFPTKHEIAMRNILFAMKVYSEFKEQQELFGYIVDFVHSGFRLGGNCKRFIIEVDGASHTTRKGIAWDRTRDAVFVRNGYRILRVKNKTLDQNPALVAQAVDEMLKGEVRLPNGKRQPAIRRI